MPMITCPACRGTKIDDSGQQCWGCNGHGIVEVTSDDEADIVRRGNHLYDRTKGKAHGLGHSNYYREPPTNLLLFIFSLASSFIGGVVWSIVMAFKGEIGLAPFFIGWFNCLMLGAGWGVLIVIFNLFYDIDNSEFPIDFLLLIGGYGYMMYIGGKIIALTAAQAGAFLWNLNW